MTAAGAPAIEVRGAAKTYADGTEALRRLDLVVGAGEFVTLLGPSGCGKSTLLKMVAGLLAPSAGTIRVGGRPAGDPGAAQHTGFVFQAPTLMPWASVAANVRLPLDLAGITREAAAPRVAEALAWVGLTRFAAARPHALSGGMQMRASIARALVAETQLLLMDEPFAALDEISRDRLDRELLALWRARGLTVLFVTHSIHEAVLLSSRVLVMAARPGRIVDEVAVDEPHPRGADFAVTPAFARLARRLQESLASASEAEPA